MKKLSYIWAAKQKQMKEDVIPSYLNFEEFNYRTHISFFKVYVNFSQASLRQD